MSGVRQASRVFAPGVGVVLGYVVLVGNPWVNGGLERAFVGSDSLLRFLDLLVFYPRWHLGMEEVGPFEFWASNLRVILFVGLVIAGLTGVSRWLRDGVGALGVFATTVGAVVLSSVAAWLSSFALTTILVDIPGLVDELGRELTAVLASAAGFGVLFGTVVAIVVLAQRASPRRAARQQEKQHRVNTPKSFW